MALWGGRFSSETRNEVTQYSESISFDQRLYHFDIAGSKAHVTMLAEQGIIPAETAKAIREELDRIERRIDARGVPLRHRDGRHPHAHRERAH